MGSGTAVFVAGTCFSPKARLSSLHMLVDGEPQALVGWGMPRLDFFRELHPRLDPYATSSLTRDPDSDQDPLLHSYRSGFWGLAAIKAQQTCELALLGQLEGRGETVARLGKIDVVLSANDDRDSDRAPEIAICMTTYNPDGELFERQIESIRSQSHRDWICYLSDDCSNDEAFGRLLEVLDGDERFVVSRSTRRLGFYLNFERALMMAPRGSRLVALSDQDDCWYPEKLETLAANIGKAQLVYSDARIVARDGAPIAESYWEQRRNNHRSILSLLVANSVTGAACMIRREALDRALPFPPAQFAHYHDHWLGLVALALGRIEFVDRPLYDYVQHGDASLGHAAATGMTGLVDRLTHQRRPRERVRAWRLHYFVDACRLTQLATILLLRCGSELSRGKRRAIERYLRCERSLTAFLGLGFRGARELIGKTETLGAEWMLFHAFLWRRLLDLTVKDRPQARGRLDAVPPPTLAMAPARRTLPGAATEVAEKIAPLDLAVSEEAPARINLLIPTIDLRHFFGGYIAKFNLAGALADRGLRVRIVTVDPVGSLRADWKQAVERYAGLAGLFDRIEVSFGRGLPLEVSPHDAFIATTWWTAHIAAHALSSLGRERFVYLIQEYEPFTFPMGTYAALAQESYNYPHHALFSSELLRGYFKAHKLGVYAGGRAEGDEISWSFENAISPVRPPSVVELSARRTRKLLFYARPESHAARNLFELGVLALARCAEDGVLSGWELAGIGSVEDGLRTMSIGGGFELRLVPRSDQTAYVRLLRDHDVGLALMYTPHPSLVPIEMAAAGMVTVTNTFENKTSEALAAISPNLIAAEPSVNGVAHALRMAVAGADDHERRVRGSAVRWSGHWSDSFSEDLLVRLERVLAPVESDVPAAAGATD